MRSPAEIAPTPIGVAPGDLDRGHVHVDALARNAPVDLGSDQPRHDALVLPVAASSSNGTDQSQRDVQAFPVGAESSSPDHRTGDAQSRAVGVSSNGRERHDALSKFAVGSDGSGHITAATHTFVADPSDVLLAILADQLDDIEKARIAAENRLRSLAQVKRLAGSKAEATLQVLTEEWLSAEKRITLELNRAMRKHRFGPWVKSHIGLGEKQAPRLIAAIGDPLVKTLKDPETGERYSVPRRGPAELWAYCGYRPDQGKRKGQLHAYNWEAKMRAFLCAESVLRATVRKLDGCDDSDGYDYAHRTATTPFGERYLAERKKWNESPKHRDKPDAHKHAHALRVVAKEILKDLWRYAARSGTDSVRVSPAATDQLRTAKPFATPRVAPPSDLRATAGPAAPIDTTSPDPISAPAPPSRSGA